MYDVRLITKLGIHFRRELGALGANISFPSLKLFGDGSVLSSMRIPIFIRMPEIPRHQACCTEGASRIALHILRILCRLPPEPTIMLHPVNPSCCLRLNISLDYLTSNILKPGMTRGRTDTITVLPGRKIGFPLLSQNPVLNVGVAFKEQVNARLMVSGGFRTDFGYLDPVGKGNIGNQQKNLYTFDVYHINLGLGYAFKRGSIIMGTQYSNGRANDHSRS
ncbi:MAG: hypothetical protein MZW92_44985 [Comamonadaceae bacterium]|nr:hypothetical protein [Comamonadaceae bacterium]